ncbi:MAG: L-serine ammonia-lyase [Pseudomonadota bacterium]
MLSVLDVFKVGIGPSSSHTVGPMRIAFRALQIAKDKGVYQKAHRVRVELQGSLALTGVGHGSDKAAILGLLGFEPETIDPEDADRKVAAIRRDKILRLPDGPSIKFDPAKDIDFRGDIIPELHPNGMRVAMYDENCGMLMDIEYYSVGGGFIASAQQLRSPANDDVIATARPAPHPFRSAAELLSMCEANNLAIDDLVLENEDAWRSRAETLSSVDRIWEVMNACIDRGLSNEGVLPGGLNVVRRAPSMYHKLSVAPPSNEAETIFDWLNVFAMAVNEENAAGGQVVTAPTNGAAGIIPAVMRRYCADDAEARPEAIRKFLLTSGAVGVLYKQRASISGAEMGCQGEVGVACSMAAAGLAAVWGGTPDQVEHAAEIGMEHNLGLTCDPVGGLVQIPCIERNAIGAVKAVNAARLALQSTGPHKVSLDQVIETMRQTGLDMNTKYKETSQGGLAVNVVEC